MPRLCKQTREHLTSVMRSKIRTEFVRLIAEHQAGQSVTMEDVATSLGIAKGTIYLYYKTKDELVLDAWTAERNAQFEKIRRKLQPGIPAPEQLAYCAEIMMEDFRKSRWLRLEFFRNNPFPAPRKPDRLISLFSGILRTGIEEGSFRPVPVEDTALFIRNAIIGQFRYLLRTGEPLDMERSMGVFRDMILRALRNDAKPRAACVRSRNQSERS